ncbi:hypothetical protein M422DRAFT_153670 [Sphaerobolus stellatus SS14]|nr:hypothetical protein M422DRAFT_153670 [Sphaerobolus stellatus SS14]
MSTPSTAHLTASALFDVTGFIAVVTGGGTGIGLMIAKGLATNGAKVYITGRRKEVLEKVASEVNTMESVKGELVPIQCDVTSKDSIQALVQTIENTDGKLHILVNNAGQVGPTMPFLSSPSPSLPAGITTPTELGSALFASQSFTDWSTHFSINVSSVFFVSVAFIGLLAKGTEEALARGIRGYMSTIVNVSSISGLMKLSQNHFAYNTAKAATSHLTKLLGTELALKKVPIRVNAIAPGAYASEMTNRQGQLLDDEVAHRISKGLERAPSGRGGTEQEMAATALYIGSPAGCFLNGQEIVIDGGFLMVNPSTR